MAPRVKLITAITIIVVNLTLVVITLVVVIGRILFAAVIASFALTAVIFLTAAIPSSKVFFLPLWFYILFSPPSLARQSAQLSPARSWQGVNWTGQPLVSTPT